MFAQGVACGCPSHAAVAVADRSLGGRPDGEVAVSDPGLAPTFVVADSGCVSQRVAARPPCFTDLLVGVLVAALLDRGRRDRLLPDRLEDGESPAAEDVRDRSSSSRTGTAGDVDLSYLPDRGGVFALLQDEEYFRRLRADAEAGTIVWPNEADIAPGDAVRARTRSAGQPRRSPTDPAVAGRRRVAGR